MPNFQKVIFCHIEFLIILFVCFRILGWDAVEVNAASNADTVNVYQTVDDEGNGNGGNNAGRGGGIALPINATPPDVFNIKIYDVGRHSARISWDTDDVCLAEIYYGITENYEAGMLSAHPESYLNHHEFILTGLQSDRKYYLKFESKNQRGITNTITNQSFYTVPEFFGVPNAGSLVAGQSGKNIILSWENPNSADFRGVQINRKTGSATSNTNDGEKIFAGVARKFFDADVADKTVYYYTVFSYNDTGNFSSGASVSIKTDFTKPVGVAENLPPENNPSDKPQTLPVGSVENLKAVADIKNKKITISWECPQKENSCEVVVRKQSGFLASSPSEGELVYGGSEKYFEDTSVSEGKLYFYTVFVKSKEGIYSKGKAEAAALKENNSTVQEVVNFVDVRSGVDFTLGPEQKINIFEGSILGINYKPGGYSGNLKLITAKINNNSYVLDLDERSQSYRTSFAVPQQGEYDIEISIINADEVVFGRSIRVAVLPYGRVYAAKNRKISLDGLSLEALSCHLYNFLGRHDQQCERKLNLQGVEVEVFTKNSAGIWGVWGADEFNQDNPFFTDSEGKFGFIVPNGEYRLIFKKPGFEEKVVEREVKNNSLTENVEIYRSDDKKYGIIIVVILVVAALFLRRIITNARKIKNRNPKGKG